MTTKFVPLLREFEGTTPLEVLRAAAEWVEAEGHTWVAAVNWGEHEWVGSGGSDPYMVVVVMVPAAPGSAP